MSKTKDISNEAVLREINRLFHYKVQGRPIVFISSGNPDGATGGVTVWEHGTTTSLYLPKGVVEDFVQKVLAVAVGESKGEMVQR